MEDLWGLACLVSLAALILPFIVFALLQVRLNRLRDEVANLTARLGLLETEGVRPRVVEPIAPATSVAFPPSAADALARSAPQPAASPVGSAESPDLAPVGSAALPAAAQGSSPSRSAAPPGLERLLGTRLFVWVGAVALALSGTFLVRYAVDQGWLGPAVRVLLGTLFGIVLLTAGERLRRVPRIGAALSAAGVAALFASFYAAASLYNLIPAAAGFALLGLNAAAGVALSLRQGRLVAVVGLIGGYLTPILIHSDAAPGPAFFAYLLLLLAAMLAVTDRRGWWGLATGSMAAGLLWVLLVLVQVHGREEALWPGLFILASIGIFVFTALRSGGAAGEWSALEGPVGSVGLSGSAPRRLPVLPLHLAMGGSLLAQMAIAARTDFGIQEWLFLGLLGAAALVLGRLREPLAPLAWLGAGLTGLLLLVWGAGLELSTAGQRFLWTCAAFGALYAAGAWLALWRAARPARWAALTSASAVGSFLLGYSAWSGEMSDRPWGLTALALAALLVLAAWPVLRRRAGLQGSPDSPVGEDPQGQRDSADLLGQRGLDGLPRSQGNAAVAALAAGSTTFVTLAAPLLLNREWYAVAWSAELAALAFLAWRLAIPQLRYSAWPLLAMVALRLLTPGVLSFPLGERPLFNSLLLSYGLPILALVVGERFSRRAADKPLTAGLDGLAFLLTFTLITLQVRQAFHGSRLAEGGLLSAENYSYSLAWVVFGCLLLAAGVRWRAKGARWASLPVMLLAVGKVFLFDAASLGGLYRVLSFLGLGLSLVALGWVYQRFVFRDEGT